MAQPALYNNKSCCEGVLGPAWVSQCLLSHTSPYWLWISCARAEPGYFTSYTFTGLTPSTDRRDIDFLSHRTLPGQAHTHSHMYLYTWEKKTCQEHQHRRTAGRVTKERVTRSALQFQVHGKDPVEEVKGHQETEYSR